MKKSYAKHHSHPLFALFASTVLLFLIASCANFSSGKTGSLSFSFGSSVMKAIASSARDVVTDDEAVTDTEAEDDDDIAISKAEIVISLSGDYTYSKSFDVTKYIAAVEDDEFPVIQETFTIDDIPVGSSVTAQGDVYVTDADGIQTRVMTGTSDAVMIGSGDNIAVITLKEVEDNDPDEPKDKTLKAITISSSSAEITVGGTTTLSAIATYSDGTTSSLSDSDVTWKTSDSAIASINSADGEAVVTGVAVGSATITVTSNTDESISASCTITVTQSTGENYVTYTVHYLLSADEDSTEYEEVEDLKKTGTTVADVFVYTFMEQFTTETIEGYTYRSFNYEFDDDGNLTLNLIYVSESGGTAEEVTLTNVTLSETSVSVEVGNSLTLTATATYSDGTTALVTSDYSISTSDESVATVKTNSDGEIIVTGIAVGTTTITVTVGDTRISASCTITVNEVAKTTTTVTVNFFVQKEANSSEYAENAQFPSTTIEVDDVDDIDESTILKYIYALTSAGYTLNEEKSDSEPTLDETGNYVVNLYFDLTSGTTEEEATLTSIALSQSEVSVEAGKSAVLAATATYSDNTTVPVTSDYSASSSDESVASVNTNSDGEITVTGISAGEATITVVVTSADISMSVTCSVTVTAASSTVEEPETATSGISVTLDQTTFTDKGENVTVTATQTDSSITLTATSTTGVTVGSYQWYLDGTALNGATTSAYELTEYHLANLKPGIHHVTLVFAISGETYSVWATFTVTK